MEHANNININTLEKKLNFDKKKVDKELYLISTVLNKMQNSLITELEKNKKQQDILIHQTQLAQVGKMINLIAHQWRQPLSVISAEASGLLVKQEYSLLEERDIHDTMHSILDRTENLSQTIEEFRDFYNQKKDPTEISISRVVKKSYDIIKPLFTKNNITVVCNYNSDKKVLIREDEILHVLLNILQNAVDSFIEKKTENPKIVIEVFDKTEEYSAIIISDSGGGTDEKYFKYNIIYIIYLRKII